MDVQQILAMVLVAGAVALVVRNTLGRKKKKNGACANCECGSEKAAAPRETGRVLKH